MLKLCFIPKKLYLFANWIIFIIQSILFKEIEKKNIKRVLVYRVGTLGDNITAMPSIYNIIQNYPHSKIDLLCSGGGNSVLSMDKLIDDKYFNDIVNYDNYLKKDLINRLKKNQYDLVIELPNNLATFFRNIRNMIFFRFFLGIKTGFGWKVSTIKLFKRIQDGCIKFENEIDRLQNILKENNIQINSTKFILKSSQNEQELYEKNHIYNDKNIAIVVGAKRPQNRWPIEYFQEVINFVLSKSYKVFIIGGQEDSSISKILNKNENLFDLCGKLTPLESASIFKKCKLTITNDTGPMHLSYAVNSKVLALFSARDFQNKWYPPKDNNIILRDNDINCRVCLNDNCKDNKCMKNIKPIRVIKYLEELL